MLVLSRKKSESFVIEIPNSDQKIEISINDIYSDKVKVCIDADKQFKIVRKELVETVNINKLATTKKPDINKLKNFVLKK